MSYFRRGYNWEQIHYLAAPTGGVNQDANAWEIPENQAAVLDNFLIQPGKIVARGGFQVLYDLSSYSPLNVCGIIPVTQPNTSFITIGRRSGNLGVDPWNSPLANSASGDLVTASTTVVTTYFGSISTATWTLDQIPGPRWINYDGSWYGISYDASTAPTTSHDTNATYTTKNTNLLIFNGTAPTVASGAPRGMFDLKGHLGRLWMLGGVDVPGAATVHNPTVVFFSNPMPSPGGLFATDWQDPASGLTNQIVMDHNNSDPGRALAVTRNVLVVLRLDSIWAVYGTTTANFTVKLVSKDAGCLDARSVVESDRGVYFMGEKGLMLTNGVTVANVSGSVQHTLQQVLSFVQPLYYSKNQFPYITCAQTAAGGILVSIGWVTSGSVNPLWSGLYDPTSNAWTRITSSLWSGDTSNNGNNYPGIIVQTQGVGHGVYAFGNKYSTVLEDLSQANLSLSASRYLNTPSLYDRVGTSYSTIPLRWKTRIVPIVGATTLARKHGQVKRYFLDHTFAVTGSHPLSAWQVTPVDVNGAGLSTTLTATKTSIAGTTGPINGYLTTRAITRDNVDMPDEVDDFSFDITGPLDTTTLSNVPTDSVAELYGVGVEFQPTRDLR